MKINKRINTALERILFYLILLLLAFIPLYPKLPSIMVHGTFVAIRLEDFLIATTLLIFGVFILLSNKLVKLVQEKIFQAVLLFLFIGFVSTFSAVYVTHSVSPLLAILHFMRRVEFIMLMPLVYTVFKTRKQLLTALFLLGGVILLVDVYALMQQYLNFPVISTTNSEFSKGQILYLSQPAARVNSTFAGHYDLAIFLALALSLMTSVILGPIKKRVKVFLAGLIGLSFLVLVMTAARLSFVAGLAGITFSIFLVGKKWMIGALLLAAIVAVAYPSQLRERLVSTITVNILHGGERYKQNNSKVLNQLNIPTLSTGFATDSPHGIFSAADSSGSAGLAADIAPGEPLDSTQLGVYRSFQIRLIVEWPRAIRAFIKNPLLGTGYSSLELATDNDLLRSIGETGILGTLALLLVMIEVIKRVWCNFRESRGFWKYFSAGSLAMIFALLLNGMFIDVFEASKVASLFWMVLGLNLIKSQE